MQFGLKHKDSNVNISKHLVQMCKNKGSCSYQNCWFRHDTHNEQKEEQHGVTENILNLMKLSAKYIVVQPMTV